VAKVIGHPFPEHGQFRGQGRYQDHLAQVIQRCLGIFQGGVEGLEQGVLLRQFLSDSHQFR